MDEVPGMKAMDGAGGQPEARVLHSQLLQWSSDGALLAVADTGGVSLVPFKRDRSQTKIQQPGVTAIAAFSEQVWTLDEQRRQLRRFHADGTELGDACHLAVAPCSRWIVATSGGPAVFMEGNGRRLLLAVADKLIENENKIPAVGVAFPLHGRQHVFCSLDRRVLWGTRSFPVAAGIAVLGGAAVRDAKSLLLIVRDPRGGHGVLVVDTSTARVQQSFGLMPTEVSEMRVAAQRGILVIRTSDRRFAIVDLLLGSVKGFVEAPLDVEDFAVDPAANRIAIRTGAAVFVYSLMDLAPSARPELTLALGMERLPQDARATAPKVAPAAVSPRFPLASPPQSEAARLPLAVGASLAHISMALEPPDESTRRPPPAFGWEELAPPPANATQPSPREAVLAPRATDSPRPPLPANADSDRLHDPPLADDCVRTSGTQRPSAAPDDEQRAATDAHRTHVRRLDRTVEAPVVHLFKLGGFGPPPRRPNLTRHEAMRMLLGELRRVELRALLAIAHGWDSGRIAYANESRHPQELEAAAILSPDSAAGRAREHVEMARAALAEHERVLASDESRRAVSTPLGALAAELQLSPLAIDILLVVLGPRARGELRRVYGILANEPSRATVDELLIEQILADTDQDRSDIAHELEPDSPLCRFGLVHVDETRPRPHAPLVVDPVVVARLRAEPIHFGARIATSVHTADRALSELLVPNELLLDAQRYLAQTPSDNHQVRIAVRGPVGSGRRALLAAIAHKAGRELALVDLKRLPREPEAFALALRTELRRALLCGLVPCLIRLDDVATGGDDPVRTVIQDVLRSHPGPAAVRLSPREKVPLDPGYLLLDLKPPTESQRLEVWREALAAYRLSLDHAQMLASRYRVGPGTIWRAVRAVAEARAEQGRLAGDVRSDLETHLRQTREVQLGEHARRVDRLATWDSLVASDDIVQSLRELIGRGRHHRTVFDEWGFDRVVATARGVTALFEGPPGTGKTLAAGVVARELGRDLYRIDLSKVMSKWIGESEKNIAAIFDAAEDGQVILLFDEADSLFAKRSQVETSNDRFANLQVNYLLQRLDEFEGFAILTTNLGTSIDPAFKRRLSFRLTFPFPDAEAREQLWRVHLPRELPVDGHLDLYTLARKYEISGGYIRNACLRAAFLAAEDGTPLTQQHLEHAVQLEYADVGKLSRGGRME